MTADPFWVITPKWKYLDPVSLWWSCPAPLKYTSCYLFHPSPLCDYQWPFPTITWNPAGLVSWCLEYFHVMRPWQKKSCSSGEVFALGSVWAWRWHIMSHAASMTLVERHLDGEWDVHVELLMSHMQYCGWGNIYVYFTVCVKYDALCIGRSPPPTLSRIYCVGGGT